MRELLEARGDWLTVFRLPPYTPDLNPAEGVWAHLKKSLANLAACTTRQLAAKARTRLKKMGSSNLSGAGWVPVLTSRHNL